MSSKSAIQSILMRCELEHQEREKMTIMRTMQNLEDRFWSKVRKTPGCWIWTGGKMKIGPGFLNYGVLRVGNRGISAHRVSWEIHHGKIPKGKQVCHRCDIASCVRPEHLFIATQSENMKDAWSKGRIKIPDIRGEKNGMASLTNSQAAEIRASFLNTADLAKRFSASIWTIRRIRRGATFNV